MKPPHKQQTSQGQARTEKGKGSSWWKRFEVWEGSDAGRFLYFWTSGKEIGWPLGAGGGPQLTSSKEMETSVLQLQGAKFGQQPEWAWTQISGLWDFVMATLANSTELCKWLKVFS